MPRDGAWKPTLDAVTQRNRQEAFNAAFLELVVGASMPLRSAHAAAWEKLVKLVVRSYSLPSRHTFAVDNLPRHQILENWSSSRIFF